MRRLVTSRLIWICTVCKRSLYRGCLHVSETSHSRPKLSNAEVRKKRNVLFDQEQSRQRAFVRRIEKISVTYNGVPEDCTLIMNKDISTPYNCAMHMREYLMRRTVVALVNGVSWDMHRPLTEDCTIQFLHMMDEHPQLQNKIFWRTCSFLLGHIMETAFKDEHYVELCSFPKCDATTGSFVYDVNLNMEGWKPTSVELNCLSTIGGKLCHQSVPSERLDIDPSLALEMFEDNQYKVSQIPDIAASSRGKPGTLTIYRMGEHVDISRGPLLASTDQIGRFRLSAIHDIESPVYGKLQRVQGLATPTDQYIHWFSFDYLVKRSEKLNKSGFDYQSKSATKFIDSKEDTQQESRTMSAQH